MSEEIKNRINKLLPYLWIILFAVIGAGTATKFDAIKTDLITELTSTNGIHIASAIYLSDIKEQIATNGIKIAGHIYTDGIHEYTATNGIDFYLGTGAGEYRWMTNGASSDIPTMVLEADGDLLITSISTPVSPTTGALQVLGGAYFANKIYAGNDITAWGDITAYGTGNDFVANNLGTAESVVISENAITANDAIAGDELDIKLGSDIYLKLLASANSVYSYEKFKAYNTTDATAPDTGALQVLGGLYVAKQIYSIGVVNGYDGFLMPNNKYLKTQDTDGNITKLIGVNANDVYVGDIDGELTGALYFRVAGANTLSLISSGLIASLTSNYEELVTTAYAIPNRTYVHGRITEKSADYTVTDTDNYMIITMARIATQAYTMTLPTLSDNLGNVFRFKNVADYVMTIQGESRGTDAIDDGEGTSTSSKLYIGSHSFTVGMVCEMTSGDEDGEIRMISAVGANYIELDTALSGTPSDTETLEIFDGVEGGKQKQLGTGESLKLIGADKTEDEWVDITGL